jgi:hypothetical protein
MIEEAIREFIRGSSNVTAATTVIFGSFDAAFLAVLANSINGSSPCTCGRWTLTFV